MSTPGRLDAELVRKGALAGLPDLSAQPFPNRTLIDEWDRLGAVSQNVPVANLLSSHMWAVAEKS